MAVTLVATAGASTANAYITATNADAYLLHHPGFSTWDALATTDKERYLIMATRQIDMETLDGVKADTSIGSGGVPAQALHFPRSEDAYGGTFYIPAVVQNACCEQALYLAERGGASISKRRLLQLEGVVEAQFDNVRERYDIEGGGTPQELSPRVRQMLLNEGLIVMSAGWA